MELPAKNPVHESDTASQKSSSVNSASAAAKLVQDTLLDRVVERFSFIDDHAVRGRWRTVLTLLVISFPITVFVVMMWFFLYKDCTPQSNTYERSGETSSTLLSQQNIHYCGSFFIDQTVIGTYYEGQVVSQGYQCCSIGGRNFNFEGRCKAFAGKYAGVNCNQASHYYYSNAPDCSEVFNNVLGIDMFTVSYVECATVGSAIANSIQYAVYATVLAVYLYLFLRVVKKYGFCGAFKYDNWKVLLNNAKPTAWRKDGLSEIV